MYVLERLEDALQRKAPIIAEIVVIADSDAVVLLIPTTNTVHAESDRIRGLSLMTLI